MGWLIDAADFVTAVLLIYGLKQMASPVTARRGIVLAGVGMLVAVLVSLLYALGVDRAARSHLGVNLALAAIALGVGLAWAWWRGRTVHITAMPQMVALYNGMGGGAAAAIAAVELLDGKALGGIAMTVAMVGALIGSVSFSGSLIAWAKLDGRIKQPWRVRGRQIVNGAVFLTTLALGTDIIANGGAAAPIVGLFFGLVGILVAPFVGAFVGEVIARGQVAPAARVGFGTWIGFVAGALAKFALVLAMVGVFVTSYLID